VGIKRESLVEPGLTPAGRLAALAALTLLFLGVAAWNGFPLVFYDTGAYMAEGLSGAFFVERSPVYSLFLPLTGAFHSLWLVAAAQSLMTAFIILELARVEAPRLGLGRLLLIGAALMGLTGIGWYAGQIEPDCFTPLVVLGSYLLLFRFDAMTQWRRWTVIAITALAVASHPSHFGLIGGLLIVAALLKSLFWFHPLRPSLAPARVARKEEEGGASALPATGASPSGALRAEGEADMRVPVPKLWPCLSALLLSLALVVTANYFYTRTIFVSRAGSIFLLARLMQDGIVQRLLADTCPPQASSAKPPYSLCAYGAKLPRNANAWIWGEHSSFHALGGFKRSDDEYGRIARDSLARYPWMHLKAAVYDSALQFLEFKTGDGIESQRAILEPGFRHSLPAQLPAYLAARQQTRRIRFDEINLVHVPVAVIALLGVLLLLHHAAARRHWDAAVLPATVLLALLGNAIICGTFSNPHDRYQSRLMWMPVLVLLLARAKDPRALQPVREEGS